MAKIYPQIYDSLDHEGKAGIYIYFSGPPRRKFNIDQRVLPSNFIDKVGVSEGDPNHKVINAIIAKKVTELRSEKLVHDLQGKQFIPNKKKQQAGSSFFSFCRKEVDQIIEAKSKKPPTIRRHEMELRKIEKYDVKTDAKDITADWLEQYKLYLHKVHPGKSAMSNTFKFIRTMTKALLRTKTIKEDPFLPFNRPATPESKKLRYLAPEEVIALVDFAKSPEGKPFLQATLWQLYACYCGARYSDWILDSIPEYLAAGKIEMEAQFKTEYPVTIPIYPRLQHIMELIVDVNLPPLTNQQHNLTIKSAAIVAKINHKVSSHYGRHSFGVFLADNDVPPQVAQKLLGHKNIKDTMIYYQVLPKKVEETVRRLLY